MIMECGYPGCTVNVPPRPGRGRPRKYCDSHRNKASSKRAVRFAELLARDPCCADAKLDNPRVRSCPQHKEWRQFLKRSRRRRGTAYDAKLYADMMEHFGGDASSPGFRIAFNDSYLAESRSDYKHRKIAEDFIASKTNTPTEGENSPGNSGGQDYDAA